MRTSKYYLVLLLALLSCAEQKKESSDFNLGPPKAIDPCQILDSSLAFLDICWQAHSDLKPGSQEGSDIFFPIELVKVLEAANQWRNHDIDASMFHSVTYSRYDFKNWIGDNGENNGHRFVASFDKSKRVRKIRHHSGKGVNDNFEIQLFPVSKEISIGFISSYGNDSLHLQSSNGHCGFFLFEKGSSINFFFSMRQVAVNSIILQEIYQISSSMIILLNL